MEEVYVNWRMNCKNESDRVGTTAAHPPAIIVAIPKDQAHCPPGLAKKGCVPPGQKKKGGGGPPGQQKKGY